MNTKTKKIIAKEIIYFFSIVSFLLLVWAGIEIRNSFLRNKMDNFSNEISDLNIQIDSIERTYSNSEGFLVPLSDIQAKPREVPSLDELDGKTSIQQALYDFDATIKAKPNLTNKELLLKFPEFNNDVEKLHSAFDYSKTLNSGKYKNANEFNFKFPEFFGVGNGTLWLNKANIQKLDSIELKMLNNNESDENRTFVVNDFIKKYGEKKSVKPNKVFEELKKTKKEINQKLQEAVNKLINRNETKSTIAWGTALLLGLLYPFRFIFFLLKWALKTVKQKD